MVTSIEEALGALKMEPTTQSTPPTPSVPHPHTVLEQPVHSLAALSPETLDHILGELSDGSLKNLEDLCAASFVCQR